VQTGAPGLSAWHPAFSFAAPAKAFKDFQSPLVLDLNGDAKLALTNVWDESKNKKNLVRFDMALEGRAFVTGWVKPADGFLAFDRNGNGKIDDAAELFGEYTGGEVLGPKTFKTGFDALGVFDTNRDGVINANDKDFGKLVVWSDLNQNGVTDKGELRSLASLEIASINLSNKDLKDAKGAYPLNAGNEVRFSGTFSKVDGKTYQIADVWFKQRRNADQATAMVRWLMTPPNSK
jgi:hypothetical protein